MNGFLQKIYYKNKPLYLTTNKALIPSQHKHFKLLEGACAKHFNLALELLDEDTLDAVALFDEKKENLEKELLWNFEALHSAGGVITNERQELLMIYRRKKWDLPKGKQDEGENLESCALREVKEETGIDQVELIKKITNSMHLYPMGAKMILKFTAWYLMQAPSSVTLIAQEEEQIEKVEWVKRKEISKRLENSFETLRDVLKEAQFIS